MAYWTGDQQKILDRIKVYKAEVAEAVIHDEPCKLSYSQLGDLERQAKQLARYCDMLQGKLMKEHA